MKKMFKTILVLFAVLLCFAGAAMAEGAKVEWDMDALAAGELSASLSGAEDGLTAVLALYDGDTLVSVSHKTVRNSVAELKADVQNAENGAAKLMLWNWKNMSPASPVLSTITPTVYTLTYRGSVIISARTILIPWPITILNLFWMGNTL